MYMCCAFLVKNLPPETFCCKGSMTALAPASRPLRSLDLFSGIGGLTIALNWVAEPVAYCDSAPSAQRVLRARMDDGGLPRAPVCSDVCNLDSKWLRKHAGTGARPEAIVAGFPCVGFSIIGKRQGFDNEQSALFFEMLHVIDAFRVNALFLENVPQILKDGMATLVTELAQKRGFELRWCLFSACEAGAPHRRTRWYCVALRGRVRVPLINMHGHTFDWTSKEPARMSLSQSSDHAERHYMLGNSVVPCAARAAFKFLLEMRVDTVARQVGSEMAFPQCGFVSSDLGLGIIRRRPLRFNALDLVLEPNAFESDKLPNVLLHQPLVTKSVKMDLWGTPTSNTQRPANYLTKRSKTALHTQVRFEKSTPSETRAGRVCPEFIEWMMGYRVGWTS